MTRTVTHITVHPSIEVVVEQEDGSWGAYVPGMPGIVSVGDTRDEVEKLIVEAIELAIEAAVAEDLRARAQ